MARPERHLGALGGLPLFLSLLLITTGLSSVVLASRLPREHGSEALAGGGQIPGDPGDDDPDLPAFLRGSIDKSQYLRMREEYIALLRGLPHNLPYNPRAKAIVEMERQHALMKTQSVAATSWTELGPAPIPNGQTSPTNPVSGRVTAIAVHPTNPDTVYVGTAQGGLYRSLDGGNTWLQLFDNAQSLAIGAIAIDPIHPSIVFVGTGEGNLSIDSYFGVGIYIIRNADSSPSISGPFQTRVGGNGNAFLNSSITAIVVSPVNDSVIYVGSTLGIGGISFSTNLVSALGLYYSSNALSGSPTFTLVTGLTSSGVGGVTDLVMKPGSKDTLVAGLEDFSGGTANGIYRCLNASAGAGSTWIRTLNFSNLQTNVRFAANKVGSTVTILAGYQSGNGAMVKSTDGGTTWSAPLPGLNSGYCGGQCWYDIAPAIDPTNANIIYVGGSADATGSAVLQKSTNGGTNFSLSDAGLHADEHAIAIAPNNPSLIYTGNDGGIFKSTNAGSTWISLNNSGFNAIQFQSVAVHPTNANFCIGGTQDNGTNWRHPSGVWSRADFGDGGFALIDQNATDTTNVTMYHTYFNATNSLIGFARVTTTTNATDNGWSFFGCGGTANGISCSDAVNFYAPMALGPGNPNTLYFGTDRLYRSSNMGTTMTVVSQAPLVSGTTVSAIGISPQNDSVRIVGLKNGKVFSTSTASSTLTDVTGPIPAFYMARAVIDHNTRKTAYVTLSGFGLAAGQHVWKTTNLNAATPTWTAAGSGIPDVPVNGFAIDPLNSTHLFAGTDIAVYVSTDGGSTWNPLGTGLPHVAVFDMAIQNFSRVLRIATHGRGLWEIPIDVALPIQLANFTASTMQGSKVRLDWMTVSEVDNYGFEIQRHPDSASIFQSIPNGFIPGHGTTTEMHSYTYTDEPPVQGTFWYRLMQTDLDGAVSFSEALAVNTRDAELAAGNPGGYILGQNYPNPFNPTTILQYQVPGASDVKLRVFDLLGREVATLVNESKSAGTYEVRFDAHNLASGVYFYRIEARPASGDPAGTFVETKRLVVLK